MEDKVKALEERIEQLEAIIASLATIQLLDLDNEIGLKINEILSKFNIK